VPENITFILKVENEVKSKNKFSEKKRRQLKPSEFDEFKASAINLTKDTLQRAKNLVSQSLNVTANRYFNMSENYLLENELDNVKSVVRNASSFAQSIVTGVKLGSTLGVGGAVVGGALGAASSLISSGITYQSKLSGYYSALNSTNANTDWNARRLGLNDGGRGTEN
jgi:hypothetical protein